MASTAFSRIYTLFIITTINVRCERSHAHSTERVVATYTYRITNATHQCLISRNILDNMADYCLLKEAQSSHYLKIQIC